MKFDYPVGYKALTHFGVVSIVLAGLFAGTYVIMAIWRSLAILQMVCSTVLVLLTWVLCIRIDFSGEIGRWLGSFTLELFLVHSAILGFFYDWGITNAGWSIIVVMLVCIVAGYVMNRISNGVFHFMTNKR